MALQDDQRCSPPPQVRASRMEVMEATSNAFPEKSTGFSDLIDMLDPLDNGDSDTRTITSVSPARGKFK